MPDLFNAADRKALEERFERLSPDSARQWGTMDPAQMMAHCAVPLEMANDGRRHRQRLIGRLLAPLVRKKVLGDQPFSHNAPTDPDFVIRDPRGFEAERARLVAAIERFAERGPEAVASTTHPFFGRLSGLEWGSLMAKHLDHHLRQFGA